MNKVPRSGKELKKTVEDDAALQKNAEEVTLKKIADSLGVSCSTVSRALREHPRISYSTIQKVQEIARRLGYRRDARLTALMTHLRRRRRTNDRPVMAFLFKQHFPVDQKIFHQSNTIFGGMWFRAWENGYQPEIFNMDDYGPHPQRLDQILWSRGIQGVILCPVECPTTLPNIEWKHFSMVAVGFSVKSDRLHRCVNNTYQGMLSCINKLRSLGYGRLGAVISRTIDERTLRSARAAYLVTRDAERGRDLVPVLTVAPGHETAVVDWWTKWKPEAVICAGCSPMVLSALSGKGVSVPEDIGLADLQVSDEGSLSGIDQNSFEVGVTTVDLLITLLQNNQLGLPDIPRTVLVNGHWVDGKTTRPIAPRSRV